MGKVILVHANCHNSKTAGDFAFAANIAKDLISELKISNSDIEVILVSTLEGIKTFTRVYGPEKDNHILVEGKKNTPLLFRGT